MTSSRRWTIVEYGQSTDILREIARETTLSVSDVRQYIEAAGDRIAQRLRLTLSPLFPERDRIRAEGVAGVVRVSPQIEIEIAPKFLGDGSGAIGWREDFFYLATLSRYGRLLPSERLRSGKSTSRDLPTLVARAVIEMYERQCRRPLRTYRHSTEYDFALDGDPDVETLLLPSPEGFEQTVVRYDRRNAYNAVIRAAGSRLIDEIRNPGVKAQLGRIVSALSPQDAKIRLRKRTVPSRSRSWQDLYDLSLDVLRGFGLNYDPVSGVKSPGYVVSTWRAWEDLLSLALRLAFAEGEVRLQQDIDLGRRTSIVDTQMFVSKLTVTPDIAIQFTEEASPLVIDAKYRTRIDLVKQRIVESDVYEALAFARASKSPHVVLLYPTVATIERGELGTVTPFEKVEVDDVTIVACQVEVRGISRGAIKSFSQTLRAGILDATKRFPT